MMEETTTDVGAMDGATEAPQAAPLSPQATQSAPQAPQRFAQQPVNQDWSLDASSFDTLEVDPDFAASYAGLAKTAGLDKGKASNLFKGAAEAYIKMEEAAAVRQSNEWIAQCQNDREFGGAGLYANLAVAKRAIDAYGTPELMQLLEESGAGSHPEVVRFFYRLGKTISEDGFIPPSQGRSVKSFDDAAEKLFGKAQ